MSLFLRRALANQQAGIENTPEQGTDGEFSKGFKSSWAGLKSTAKAAFGSTLENGEDFLLAAKHDQQAASQQYGGNTENFSDIDSLSSAGDWLKYQAGNATGSLSQMAIGGGAGSFAAKTLAKEAGKRALLNTIGATVGATATTYPQQVGENVMAMYGEKGHLDQGDAAVAYGIGAVQSALDVMPFMRALDKTGLGKRARSEIVQNLASKSKLGALGSELGKTALEEGSTEAAQETLKLAGLEWVNANKDHFTLDGFSQIMDSFAAGAVGGVAIGGAPAGMNAYQLDKPWLAPDSKLAKQWQDWQKTKQQKKEEAISAFEQGDEATFEQKKTEIEQGNAAIEQLLHAAEAASTRYEHTVLPEHAAANQRDTRQSMHKNPEAFAYYDGFTKPLKKTTAQNELELKNPAVVMQSDSLPTTTLETNPTQDLPMQTEITPNLTTPSPDIPPSADEAKLDAAPIEQQPLTIPTPPVPMVEAASSIDHPAVVESIQAASPALLETSAATTTPISESDNIHPNRVLLDNPTVDQYAKTVPSVATPDAATSPLQPSPVLPDQQAAVPEEETLSPDKNMDKGKPTPLAEQPDTYAPSPTLAPYSSIDALPQATLETAQIPDAGQLGQPVTGRLPEYGETASSSTSKIESPLAKQESNLQNYPMAMQEQQALLERYHQVTDILNRRDSNDKQAFIQAFNTKRGSVVPDYMSDIDSFNEMKGGGKTEDDLLNEKLDYTLKNGGWAAVVAAFDDVWPAHKLPDALSGKKSEAGQMVDSLFAQGKKLVILAGSAAAQELPGLRGDGVIVTDKTGVFMRQVKPEVKRIVVHNADIGIVQKYQKRMKALAERGVEIVLISDQPAEMLQQHFMGIC